MISKKMMVLCCLSIAVCCFVVDASQYRKLFEKPYAYSDTDKKNFENLIDIWYTKTIGGQRKQKRISDLGVLSALMVNKLISIIEKANLTDEIKIKGINEFIKPVVTEDATPELRSADRYAVYAFDGAFQNWVSKIEKKKGASLLSKSDYFNALVKALETFNVNYSKVNNALRQLDPKTLLPKEVTLGWLESGWRRSFGIKD